jgi:hypothetical protein
MVLLENYESKMRQYEKTMKLVTELMQRRSLALVKCLKSRGVGLNMDI